MDDFPTFMGQNVNRIVTGDQAAPGVEGYVFDGADGSQMAFWTCRETAVSTAHIQHLIPRGVVHSGEVVAGTKTIHAFGGIGPSAVL
jgi:hypothetical protein